MTTLKRFRFLLFIFCLGCSQGEVKEERTAENDMLIAESGYFRGYEPGWPPDSVLNMESWSATLANDSTIEYHHKVVILEDTLPLDAYLAFDAYGLFEVQVDVFSDQDSLSKLIIESWSRKLTDPFGEPHDLLTSRRWTTFSSSNNLVEITLSLDQTPQNRKYISLNYLETLDDEY